MLYIHTVSLTSVVFGHRGLLPLAVCPGPTGDFVQLDLVGQ
jgi:hypothetical protein